MSSAERRACLQTLLNTYTVSVDRRNSLANSIVISDTSGAEEDGYRSDDLMSEMDGRRGESAAADAERNGAISDSQPEDAKTSS